MGLDGSRVRALRRPGRPQGRRRRLRPPPDARRPGRRQEVRTFGTDDRPAQELADWLAGEGVTHVAMESTGSYWKPVWHLLEERAVRAAAGQRPAHQEVPGRKTDVKDAEWIAELLQHGLLRASFVPPPADPRAARPDPPADAADPGRQARSGHRIQKMLEDANIKLGSVATDVLGVSGRAMLRALIAGERDPVALAELASGTAARARSPSCGRRCGAGSADHHRFLLGLLAGAGRARWRRSIAELDAGVDAGRCAPFAEARTGWRRSRAWASGPRR